MKLKETSANGRKMESHKKLGSQFENVVVKTIVKYNEEYKIYQSSSLQSKQINAIKMILFIVLHVDFFFFVFFFFLFFYLVLALLLICIIYIF